MEELLRTDRLLLRRWSGDDVDAFFAVYGRAEVMRWLGPRPRVALRTVAEARDRLQSWRAREQGLTAPLGLWAVVDGPPEGSPIGTLLLMPLGDGDGRTDQVEIGWHLHPEHQGRGIATEAARAVLAAAAASGLREVLALTDLDNDRSQAVARRLGMADEGTTQRWFGLTLRQFRAELTADRG